MYRTIDTAIWTDDKFREFPAPAKLMFMYLITNPHAHVGGIYYLPDLIIHHETSLKPEVIQQVWDTLSRPRTEQDGVGLVRRDTKNEVVWVVNMLRYQGKGEKILRSVSAQLKTLHKSPLIQQFLQKYPGVKRYFRDRVLDTSSRPRTEQDEVGIQEQEQECITSANADVRAEKNGNGVNRQAKTEESSGTAGRSAKTEADRPTRKEATGDHADLIRFFVAGWKAKYGADFKFAEGRDGQHVKWLLNAVKHDRERAERIVKAYLADDDAFLVKVRHNLGTLVSQFNRYQEVSFKPSRTAEPSAAATVRF